MMRRLVKRHKGILPLDTVESIWRVIISTFTYVQAPFSVHADLSAGDALMRDSARFHFGFTVPFVPHMGAAGVVAAVSASKGDLGLVPAFDVASAGAWWSALEFDAAPKIIARLPFVERPDHPAALPVYSSSPGSRLTPWQPKLQFGACAFRAGVPAPAQALRRLPNSLPYLTGPSTARHC